MKKDIVAKATEQTGFKEVIKHSGNYLIANLATRALSFISIPVYTRIISASDYGVLTIFLGITGIIGSVLTLCTDQSISRYFFDQKHPEDFKKFVGTSSILAIGIFCVNSFILILCANKFSQLVGLNKNMIILMIFISLFNAISLTFEQIYGPLKNSKQIALSSLARVYISFGVSILIIFNISGNKYVGPIYGQIIAGIILTFYWIYCIFPYMSFTFEKKYIKYILSYSVPLIPYVLSGVIIEQFGKIAIGSVKSVSEAGFYSLALTISSIVGIIISVSHQAWNPYYFEYMNEKKYIQLDNDQEKIFRVILFVAMGVASFGNEMGIVLAKKSFSGSLYLIPIFVLGYVFYQLAFVYLRNFGYLKKTQYLALTVLLSGISNVILNYFLIPKFGETGAAFSFVLSYLLMAFFAWVFNRLFIKIYSSDLKLFIKPLLITIPFICTVYYSYLIDALYVKLLFKFCLSITVGVILFWKFKSDFYYFIKQIFKRKYETN